MAFESNALRFVLNKIRGDRWVMRDLFDKKGLFAESCIGPFPQEKPLEVIDTKKRHE